LGHNNSPDLVLAGELYIENKVKSNKNSVRNEIMNLSNKPISNFLILFFGCDYLKL
jgi:hypothetical protein